MSQTTTADLASAIHDKNGEPEVTAPWVAEHLGSFRFVDVRQPHELEGPLGHVDGVENVPLLELLSDATIDADEPLVLICRSGRRSTLAARELLSKGVTTVVSVEGGMLAWNAEVWKKTGIRLEEKNANAENLEQATYHTNGVPEVDAAWVKDNLGRFRFIDVREPAELHAEGEVSQAVNIPLQRFLQEAAGGAFERDLPLVVMCRSGGRSGRAVHALVGAGFTNASSMEGGMLGWRARGFPFR